MDAIPRFLGFVCVCSVVVAAPVDLDQEIVLAPHDGTAAEDVEIRRWQQRAHRADATADVFERLGWAYVAKARRTLDAGFHALAGKTVDVADKRFGARAGTRSLRGHALHNLHRFREAGSVARRLVAERGAPLDLALLSDVLIEQGKLAEGVAILQRMVDAKPGPEAFARIAHVRWLKGDLAGAMAATESALQASDVRDLETRSWLLVRLSGFCLQRGDSTRALALADAAADSTSSYPPALLARGRALIARGNFIAAITPLREAAGLQPVPEYQWWLADALAATGQREQGLEVEHQLKARGAAGDPRSLALYLATRGEESEKSVHLARAGLAERADVFSRDALAWALFANGDVNGAAGQMRAALVEGTKDARLFLHAGEIALARGERDDAAKHFAEACSAAATLTPSERVLLARRVPASGGVAIN
ncbi:MAG: tetratricopeptide repeat protein [Opitutaceae bacterium]